eukprot:6200383-Pleurochrysis_carterae.AAC.5
MRTLSCILIICTRRAFRRTTWPRHAAVYARRARVSTQSPSSKSPLTVANPHESPTANEDDHANELAQQTLRS